MTLNELYKSLRKRSGRAKILASCVVALGSVADGSAIMAKIVFVRDRSSRNWLALLSTDTWLADEEIIKLYKRCWDIKILSVNKFTYRSISGTSSSQH